MHISRQGIAKASIILIFATLLSRSFGFLREVVIAGTFGASATTDAFFVALTVPALFSDFVKYSVKNSFVPVFSQYRINHGDEAAWRFAGRFTKLLGLGFILLAVCLFLGSNAIITVIAPGLSLEGHSTAVSLMQYLSFLVVLLGLASVFESIYNSLEHFIVPAFAPLALNSAVIIFVLLCGRSLGALGIAIGMLVGGLLQLLVFSRIARACKISLREKIDLSDRDMGSILHHGAFIFIIHATWGVYLIIDRFLASSLQEGSISALAFADKIIQLPVGVFVLAVSIASLPQMSISVARREYQKVEQICCTGMRFLLFVVVPISIFFCLLRSPLIRILYQRGSFDAVATQLTAGPLFTYALGLCAFAAQIFILRVFFAFQDMKTPLMTGLISLAMKAALSLVFLHLWAVSGIALATSIAAVCNTALLMVMLVRRGHVTSVCGTWRDLRKLVLGWLVLVVAGGAAFRVTGSFSFSSSILRDTVQIGGTVLLGCLVYVGTLILLRAREVKVLMDTLRIGSISRLF